VRPQTRGTGSTVRSTSSSDRGGGGEEAREWLVAHLRAWERHRVRFGLTSWAIPGGIGTQNEREAGTARECARSTLKEYAQVFRAGCIDCGPDGLSLSATMRHDAEQVPQGFAFTVMLSDDTLAYRFPYGHPDRGWRGELNPGFLDPSPLHERMCAALAGLDGTLEMVVLQMQPVYRTEELRAPEFVGRLDRFLGGLPRAYRYAVDLRTPAFNVPEYRACLRDHGVAHLLCHTPHLPHHSSDAPSLIDQLLAPGILSAPFCVARVHAGPGRNHDDDDEALALGLHELVRACGDDAAALTVLIDGEAPTTVLTRLLQSLDGELARRSPLRRRAA
jgi:hypothetical protein